MQEGHGELRRRKSRLDWMYLTPMLFAPTIPLARLSMRGRVSPANQRIVMLSLIGAGLAHGAYILAVYDGKKD